MAVCRAVSLSLLGIDAVPIEVEVDVSAGLPGFSIVGLPDAAVQEARERVRVAISNSGFKFPTRKVIVNLAPLSKPHSRNSDGLNSRFLVSIGVNFGVRHPPDFYLKSPVYTPPSFRSFSRHSSMWH